MAKGQSTPFPILPLPKGLVLFPGITQRIPATASRPDIPALLSAIYARAATTGSDGAGAINNVPIACVPMASQYVGPRGQLLLNRADGNNTNGNGNRTGTGTGTGADMMPPGEAPEFEVGKSTKADLFSCGVAAKITNIEGLNGGEFLLHVEGRSRVWIDKVYQEQPCFEGKVTVYPDEINVSDSNTIDLFQKLQATSRELAQVLRVASLVTPGRSPSRLTPMLARRLDAYITNKTVAEAGVLADFMTNIVVASYDEKLQVLAMFDVQKRMVKVQELLERQLGSIRNNVRITTITIAPENGPQDGSEWNPQRSQIVPVNKPLSMPYGVIIPPHGFIMPPSAGNASGPGGIFGNSGFRRPPSPQTDQREPDEADELAKKLEAAHLSPEAAKVAERELKRLRKMVPAQAEYTVVRSYLETLAEIPWATVTEDRLGPETLAKARAQLDSDHYGLEKIKKRLLEYLAVLRLKQAVNDEVNAEMHKAAEEVEAAKAAVEEAEAKEKEVSSETQTAVAPPTVEAVRQRVKAAEARVEALQRRRMLDKSPILLLVGPPGVGKTSLARSVATSLGRKFHRISLGGVRDEAEIRGHRRTYVAAMPGLVMQGLRKVGVANPVMLLDEIDKLSSANYHGDPSAAMLEVLDPEQNRAFVDHYVSVPYDLSRVLFLATANSLDTIPAPLLDRMETIHLPGYTTLEKKHIAMQYLVPKQIRASGLTAEQVGIPEAVVAKVIEGYTREAGVRNLEREIGSVCRAKAVEYSEAKDGGKLDGYRAEVRVEDLEAMLGTDRFEAELTETNNRPGVVTGLVAYSSGGDGGILFIEVAAMPGSGHVQLTGKLGDVLKESVEVALSWVKAHAFALGLTGDPAEDLLHQRNIHVHCPSGAVPKDGPSSGMAQTIALISLFSGRAVSPSLAMTGEMTLRGRITAVGGIKEKLIGALRAGVKTVLLPAQNRKDIQDLPEEVKNGLEIVHVSHIWEAIQFVWPNAQFPGAQQFPAVESHL